MCVVDAAAVVRICGFLDLHGRGFLCLRALNDLTGEMHLVLDVADHAAAMTRADVGSQQDEKVREARNERPEIGRCIVFAPMVAQQLPFAADDVVGPENIGGLKAGSENDDIRLDSFSRRSGQRIAFYFREMFGNEVDMRLLDRTEPAIVEQHALRERRVFGQHTFDQLGAILQLFFDVAGEHAAVRVVDLVYRALGMLPLGIAEQRSVHSVVEGPGQSLLEPCPVEGNDLHQIAYAFGYLLAELREGGRPLFRPGKYGHPAYLVGNRRCDLHARCAISDDGNALARKVCLRRPATGVVNLARELIEAIDLRVFRYVENAHSAEQIVGAMGFALAVRGGDGDIPLVGRRIPARLFDMRPEAGLVV